LGTHPGAGFFNREAGIRRVRRGVGMDVVKKAIDALRGTLHIESARGRGTTITLKLPLTLAIIDGFLTRIGAEHFIFPMALVEECRRAQTGRRRQDPCQAPGARTGRDRPYVRLRDYFRITGSAGALSRS